MFHINIICTIHNIYIYLIFDTWNALVLGPSADVDVVFIRSYGFWCCSGVDDATPVKSERGLFRRFWRSLSLPFSFSLLSPFICEVFQFGNGMINLNVVIVLVIEVIMALS